MKLFQQIPKILGMSSDVGIGLLLFNILAIYWYAMIAQKPVPEGFVSVVGIIFGGKTLHSFATRSDKRKKSYD